MSLASTASLRSPRVEMTRFRLSSGRIIATYPTRLAPGCSETPCVVAQHTSNAVREICDSAVATYLNDLETDTRVRLTGRSGQVRRQEVHRLGYALFEATPYHFEDHNYLRLMFYICHKHKVVTDGDEIDPVRLRAELGHIVTS